MTEEIEIFGDYPEEKKGFSFNIIIIAFVGVIIIVLIWALLTKRLP